MKVALTIAGSDSSGGAGIQADIKTFQAHGVYAMSVITAVTVQNTQKVYDIQEIRPDIVKSQILCLFEDISINAVKIGMVSSAELIETISETLIEVNAPVVVVDPVMISKSGYKLLKTEAKKALIKNLVTQAYVLTPNILEAELLSGDRIKNINDMKNTAKKIHEMGAKNVVLKGGHLDGNYSVDVLYDGYSFFEFSSPRIDTNNTHGTGCTFSSAITANLALGKDLVSSIRFSKEYITSAIAHSFPLGKGHGPVNHFYELYRRADFISTPTPTLPHQGGGE